MGRVAPGRGRSESAAWPGTSWPGTPGWRGPKRQPAWPELAPRAEHVLQSWQGQVEAVAHDPDHPQAPQALAGGDIAELHVALPRCIGRQAAAPCPYEGDSALTSCVQQLVGNLLGARRTGRSLCKTLERLHLYRCPAHHEVWRASPSAFRDREDMVALCCEKRGDSQLLVTDASSCLVH